MDRATIEEAELVWQINLWRRGSPPEEVLNIAGIAFVVVRMLFVLYGGHGIARQVLHVSFFCLNPI